MARQRLILDTHALLWALADPGRLSANVRALLEDREVERYVSAISAYEIAQLVRRGRLGNGVILVSEYAAHLRRLRAVELPIGGRTCLLAASFPQRHRDPFDRILAAQGILDGIPIATVDPVIREFGALTTW